MKFRALALTSVLAVAGILLLYRPSADAHIRISTDVNWGDYVRPILERKCMTCHHQGGIAPDYVDLTTYGTDTQPGAWSWYASIEEMIATDQMPPWKADPRFGEFSNSTALTKEEMEILQAWLEGGRPQGPRRNLPTPPQFLETTWQFGQPDLIFGLPQGHVVPADQQFDSVQHVFDVVIEEDTYITGFEYLVESPKNIYKMEAWLHDPEDFQPPPIEVEVQMDYDLLATEEEREQTRMRPMPKGPHFIGQWLRGGSPELFPDEAGRLLRKGSTLELRIEYRRPEFANWSEPVADSSKLGLFLARPDEIIDLLVESKRIAATNFSIPANVGDHVERMAYTTTEHVKLIGIDPVMGPLGKKLLVRAEYPDGMTDTLLYVPEYSFKFPSSYRFASPIDAPAGTRIEVIGHFNNTEDNWDNPNSPPEDVSAGDGPTDERLDMMLTYFLNDHLKVQEVFVPKEETNRGGGMLGGAVDLQPPVPDDPKAGPADPFETTELESEDPATRIVLASNNYHHVEGVLPRPGAFQLFVYDDQLSPIDPRNFQGFVQVNGGSEQIPLIYAQPGDDHLTAWVNPATPLTVDATVELGGNPETIEYKFDEAGAKSGEEASATPAFMMPMHEGIIMPLGDGAHRAEATLSEKGDLAVYFYRDELIDGVAKLKALNPRNFSGTVDTGSGKPVKLGHAQLADDFLSAKISSKFPVTATVNVPIGAKTYTTEFEFDEPTAEPWDDWGEDTAAPVIPPTVGKHGGARYYEARNGFHTVEATMPRPGELRVYVYDEWKNEADPRLFAGSAEVSVDGRTQTVSLEAMPGDDFLSAYFEPAFPVEAKTTLTITGEKQSFDFDFEEVTIDPTVPPMRTAHMDHRPVHGGEFWMSDNLYHHVEGTLPSPGDFRFYFYDDFKRPLHPLNFSGAVYIEKENPETGAVTEDIYELQHEKPSDAYLSANIPPTLPIQFYVKVNLGGEMKRYDFVFEELTIAPARSAPIIGGTPAAAGPGGPCGSHSHERTPVIVPNTVEGILESITERQKVLENMIAAEDFCKLFVPAFDIADLVAALSERTADLNVRQRGTLKKLVTQLNLSKNKIDRAGDTADPPRVDQAYAEFADRLDGMRALFAN